MTEPNPPTAALRLRGTNSRADVREKPVVIGTDPEADLVLTDEYASPSHARVYVDPRTRLLMVEDMGSTNGTFVNELPRFGRTPLSYGDVIRVGRSVVVVTRA